MSITNNSNGSTKASIIEWFTLIVTIINSFSLIFLYLQQQAAEEDIRINSLGQIYSQMLEIDKMFAQNPELRLYIYYNKTPEEVFNQLSA